MPKKKKGVLRKVLNSVNPKRAGRRRVQRLKSLFIPNLGASAQHRVRRRRR